MNQNLYRVAANIPTHIRAEILRRYPPNLPVVLAKSITWAYRVPDSYWFDDTEQTITVYGIHRTLRTEALLVQVGDAAFQPLTPTRPLHLTLATAPGVQPVEAGQLAMTDVAMFNRPFTFTSHLERFPLWQLERIGKGRGQRRAA